MQLEINFDPIVETHVIEYKSFTITVTQRQKEIYYYQEPSDRYKKEYNQLKVLSKIFDSYWESHIKGNGVSHYVCGEYSDCWNKEITIECTKKYIDSFY